jgi:hypothetical protein
MAIDGFQDKQISRAVSSAFDSVAEGISNAHQTTGAETLRKAASSFETQKGSDSFSSVAGQELRQTGKISSPGQIKSPQTFFSEVSANTNQKSELAEKILNPNLKLQKGIQELGTVFQDEIKKWEEKLNSVGDDAQLSNVDLQNILQKQQQTLQMMSNISKMLYDTASSVIRKMGG